MRALSPTVQRYLIGLWCSAGFVATVASLIYPVAPLSLRNVAITIGFAVLLDIADLLATPSEQGRPLSLAQAMIIACASVVSWPLPLLAVALGTFGATIAHPAPWWRTLTVVAVRMLIATPLAGIAALTLPVGGLPYTTPLSLAGLVAMGLLAYAIERLLETQLRYLSDQPTRLLPSRSQLRAFWPGRLYDFTWHMLAVTPIGGLLALLWSVSPWALLVGLGPALLAHVAIQTRVRLHERSQAFERLTSRNQEQQRRLQSLQRLATTLIATRDMQELPHTLCDRLAALLDAQAGWVVLADEPEQPEERLYLVARTGDAALPAPELLPELTALSYASVLARRRVVLFTDQHVQALAPADDPALRRALIVIPLLIEEDDRPATAIGAICLAFEEQRGLSEDEQRLLSSFARQAALAVQNARLFRRLRESQAELIRSSKLAAVGTFAAGIAHEFNNLLAGMGGYAQLGLGTDSVEEKDESLQVVLDACRRGKSITGSLLTFARRQQPQRTLADVREAIEGTLTLMEIELRKNDIKVVRRINVVPPTICDVGQIAQVFLNLLTNARDAMKPDGGTLTVELFERNDAIVFTVEDTGCGIPDALRDRIFEPFVTTKGALGGSNTPGTGLGLSVSYGIVQEHGGSIDIVSASGRGTQVSVRLPVAEEAPLPLDELHDEPVPQLRLLLVDDDDTVREALHRLLAQAGHQVQAVDNGMAALERYRAEPFDLVLADLAMPRTDGITLVRELRAYNPDATIFVFTGQAVGDQIEQAHEAGAAYTLHKPFELQEFQQALRRVWRAREPERSVEVAA